MLNKILDMSNIGFIQCGPDGEIKSINTSAYSILSINNIIPEMKNVPGSSIFTFCSEYMRVFDRVKSEGAVKGLELTLKSPAGEGKHILNHILIDEDNMETIQVIIRDITEARRMQKEQGNIEDQLRSIINLLPDILYRLDMEGKISYVSERVANYGYTVDELLGRPLIDLVHPDDREKAFFRLCERRAGERATKLFEVRLLTKNRSSVPFEIESHEIINSQYFSISAEGIYISGMNEERHFAGTQGIARDISKKRPGDSILNLTEEKCYNILDRLHDGYYELDLNGNYKFANMALCSLYGYERGEIAGKSYMDFIVPDCFDLMRMSYEDVLTSRAATKIIDWNVLRKDGKRLQVQGSISLIRDEADKPVSYIGIVRDMTEQKKIEEELFRARKLEAIGIFSGGIAHDYNNALTTIIGNITLAKLEFGSSNDKLMEFLTDAEMGSLRVKELTQQLSTLSRGGRPVKQVKSIADIVNDVVKGVMKEFKGEYEVRISGDLWNVEIDEYQMSHVLEYIIINSIEAVDENGKISIISENVHVDKEKSHHELILLAGDYVKVTISDNGKGISQEELNSIFDPYFSTKELRSGMGLAISYAVLKRHNGYIDVRSAPGEGSDFYIYLPRAM